MASPDSQTNIKMKPSGSASSTSSNTSSNDVGDSTSSPDFRANRHKRRTSSFFKSSPPPPTSPKDFLKFNNDFRHFSMLRNLHMADYITLLNGWCGFNSIISSLRFALTSDDKYIIRAMWLVPLGLFFDFMDGRVARWRNKSSLLGQELDSLADLVSFGCAPAIIGFSLGLQSTLDVLALTVFVLCGLARLARFNVTVTNIPKDASGKSKYFEGTPIPTTLVIVGIMFYWVKKSLVFEQLPLGALFQGSVLEFHPVVGLFLLSGFAMISKSLKVPKP